MCSMKKLLFFAVMAIGFLMTSCGDDEVVSGLVITLSSPNNNSTYSDGDSFNITGSVVDDVEVSSIEVVAEGAFRIDFDISGVTDRTTVGFDEVVVIDSTLNRGTFTLAVNATDNEGNSETESIEITIE